MFSRPKTFIDHWLTILALVLGGGAAVQLAFDRFVLPRGTPIIISDSVPPRAMNSPEPGGYLKVRVYRVKVRDDCPVYSQRILINDMTKAVLLIGTALSEGGETGTEFVDVLYPMPQEIPPGGYTLRVRLSYFCPERTFHVSQPDVKFEVKI